MKNINIMLCIFGLLSNALINALPKCYEYGVGSRMTFDHPKEECPCNCNKYHERRPSQCSECDHYSARTIYYPQKAKARTHLKKQKPRAQQATRASSNS